MKKYTKLIIIIILLILMVTHLTYSYGTDEKKKQEFFEVESTETAITKNIEMTINIDNIEYNDFTLTISSNTNIQKIEVKEDSKIDVTKNNNEISMQFNKKESNLNKITLYFTIPNTVRAGEKIELTATVQNNEKAEEKQVITKKITVVEEEKKENNEETEQPDKKDNSSNENLNNENEQSKENNQNSQPQVNNTEKMQTQSTIINQSQNTQNIQKATVQNTNSENTVTYKGSDNNYLSELSVNSYDLNTEFSKENQTYFVTVNSDTESLEIISSTENSNSKINIYGNENLQEGTNKILITVTAENGNVRNYRIYATKN